MSLMKQIRDYAVPKKTIAFWWLGQIVQTPDAVPSGALKSDNPCCFAMPGLQYKST